MKSGVPLRAHLFKLLLNQRRRNLLGSAGAAGGVITSPPVSPTVGRPIGEGSPWGGGGGGWIQLEPNQVHASVPDWGFTNGYPTSTPAAGLESGSIAHRVGKSGFLDPPLTTGSVEAHDWSGFDTSGYGFPVDNLVRTHRQKSTKGTNNAGSQMAASLDVPITLAAALTIRSVTSGPFMSTMMYGGVRNASNHQMQVGIGTDANGFGNIQTRYFDGSNFYYGTLRQRQSGNLAGSYIPLDWVFDPDSSVVVAHWADAPLQSSLSEWADYPAEFPGWASFGAITNINAGMYGSGTVYSYALRGEFA